MDYLVILWPHDEAGPSSHDIVTLLQIHTYLYHILYLCIWKWIFHVNIILKSHLRYNSLMIAFWCPPPAKTQRCSPVGDCYFIEPHCALH